MIPFLLKTRLVAVIFFVVMYNTIDTEPTPLSGCVVGEDDDHYAIMLEITFVKRF